MYYTGVGSRHNVPTEVLSSISRFGVFAEKQGYILRSGGANGCDLAFEKNVKNKEIYLPWAGFNGSESELHSICAKACSLAAKFHPNWNTMGEYARMFMARNCYQVLGKSLDNPSDALVCWTPNGETTGGTGQAIRLAQTYSIPIFNFGDSSFNKRELLDFFS